MPPDGRRAKGDARRRLLLDATLRLVGRDGIAAVTQRAVAAEADVPSSAVLYYFDSVDALLVATLVEVNDRYLADLAAARSLAGLAERVAACDREQAVAEFDLYLLAARRPDLRAELVRWDDGVDAAAARLAPGREELFAAALNGLYLRAASSGLDVDSATRVLEATGPGSSPG
ncbi:TetR family transcriptional regulator [Pseudonocardia ailaonensis]|uniref:TetR family transcriptional regulator n=1 Tax=Pseudonocardia ailaonensis TaxID=367279 RepID=A0ABN2NEQ8_9PSEU